MAFAVDTDTFREWATKLGCPPDALPNEDALKSIFKSRQRDHIVNLQKQLQPRQDVQATRKNILIKTLAQLHDKMVPASHRSFLPREIRVHMAMQELNEKRASAVENLDRSRKEFDTLAASIKMKNIQCTNSTHKEALLTAKCNIVQFKSEQLTEALVQAAKNKEKIQAAIPVKLSAKNASEEQAMRAVERAISELSQFYSLCNQIESNNDNSQAMEDAKTKLWQNMRKILANVPNFLLLNATTKLKEDQLQHIMELNKSDDVNIANTKREPLNSFEIKMLKTNADLLGLVAKYTNACNEVAQLEQRFSQVYCTFVDELQQKVNAFNAIDDQTSTDELISDFILQYNVRNFNKVRNDFLTQQIQQYSSDVCSNAKQLKSHDILLSSVKQAYADINASINRVQCEMLQLTQIEGKILYSKNILRNAISSIQAAAAEQANSAKTNFLSTRLKANRLSVSLMGADSFELGNDSVFCSTKLDFDVNMSMFGNSSMRSTFSKADVTLLPTSAAQPSSLPNYLLELNTFSEIPLEKLSCLPLVCAFYCAPNPLIVESHELASTVHLAPGLLLTPFGALQEVRCRILWASAIAAHTHDLKLNFDTVIVNANELQEKSKRQQERISELLDSIQVTNVNTKHIVQKVQRIYDFMRDNPLRHFVPASRLFNNRSYADYESEYTMYYRMATMGGSIK